MTGRRLFVCMAVLGCLLLPGTRTVEAQSLSKAEVEDISDKMIASTVHNMAAMQSPGCSGYAFGTTPYTWLYATDEAALGNVAVNINFSATDGTKQSHQLHAGTNTNYNVNWKVYNATSVDFSYSWDGGKTRYHLPNTPTSGTGGSFLQNVYPGWPVGGTYTLFLTGSGPNGTSSDAASIYVSSSSPGIIHYDNLPNGLYLRINPNFGGGSMDSTCQICSQQPSACSGAQHTPYISGSMTDNTNGQVQTFQRQVAGSVVNETSPISGSAFWDISTMPSGIGDISTDAKGEIFCSAMNDDIYDSLFTMRIEYAKVVVKDLGHPGRPGADGSMIYDVAPICDNNSDPADWQPTVVHSFSGRHTYWWGVTSLVRAPDLQGVRWIALANFLVDWTPANGVLNLAKMVIEGGALPYPGGTAPDFPIPGACTQYPKNVILTLGIAARDFPFWPFNTQN